jgi:hypothetical protein
VIGVGAVSVLSSIGFRVLKAIELEPWFEIERDKILRRHPPP